MLYKYLAKQHDLAFIGKYPPGPASVLLERPEGETLETENIDIHDALRSRSGIRL